MRSGRIVRIDGEDRRSGDLDDYVAVAWLTPAMDGLFTGPASERRRFLDRLTSCFDPHYRARLNQFERAMQHRNRLLAENVFDKARFESFEQIMAETGVATAAARLVTLSDMRAILVGRRNRLAHSLFPWAELAIAGRLEAALADRPAIDVEDEYATLLARDRERDREAGRTLEGPHRSDLIVGHGPREMPAKVCSTGEQKALLIGLILAHADLIRYRRNAAPVLLLDEITAHLDAVRRTALFDEIVRLGGQTWMSGTDRTAFHGLEERAQFYRVHDGRIDGFR
jgi:DNA replication and repair protein RecF